MEEKYKKILNGEVNIKYLSPIDLINLQLYLESIGTNLKEIIKAEKDKNNQLENIAQIMQNEILAEDDTV